MQKFRSLCVILQMRDTRTRVAAVELVADDEVVLLEVVVKVISTFSAAADFDGTVVDEWTAKVGSGFFVVVVVFFRRVTTISIIRSVCLGCTVVEVLV
jgi:hypothetical protein